MSACTTRTRVARLFGKTLLQFLQHGFEISTTVTSAPICSPDRIFTMARTRDQHLVSRFDVVECQHGSLAVMDGFAAINAAEKIIQRPDIFILVCRPV